MIKILKNLLLIYFAFMSFLEVNADIQYEIKVNIEGYKDSTLLLTSYYGKKVNLIDTAYSTKPGEFVFSGEEKLPGGIYMAVSMDKKKLFEFIINDEQRFSMTTNSLNYTLNMKVEGSEENEIFYSYLKYNEEQYKTNKSLLGSIDSLAALSEETSGLKNSLDSLNKIAINYKLDLIDKNQGTFVATLLVGMRDVEIPDSIKESKDSTLSYKYFKQHYWDYFNLSDNRLLRTPIYMKKVNQYFDQLVVFHPDSVISAIDIIIFKSRPSDENVGYLVWHFISEYQNPKFMGFDKVFVHLVEKYFSKEQITNTTPSILNSLQERSAKLVPILLGKTAPNLILVDSIGSLRSFMTIPNDYTILFFWDSDCGICGKEITELTKLYEKQDHDIEIFSINVNSDLDRWKKAIIDKQVPGIKVNGTRSATKDFHDLYDIYGTPVIYLLDKDKKIIAKRIGANKIDEFIDNYEKR